MKIKRLDISGFKSFKDKTLLLFDSGITGVVGPNGCGKSNVIDAVRWCMGEQSVKNLRGKAMEDVIFAGSEKYPMMNMSEVSMTLEIAGSVLPSYLRGLSEVTVTRRLFRNGDSKYLVNGSNVRLMDVTDFFLGTGVGTRAYSIIEQGKIGAIVTARPEDRRYFIEEAAGISKYRQRRRLAERKLENTRQNLLRLTDIIEEVKRNMNSLHKQAKKAERYRNFLNELKELEVKKAHWRFLDCQKKISEFENKIRDEKEITEALSAAISAENAELEALFLEHKADDEKLGQIRARLDKINIEIGDHEKKSAVISSEIENAKERAHEAVASRYTFEERIEEIDARIKEERSRLNDLEKISGDNQTLEKIEAEITKLNQALDALSLDLEVIRRKEVENSKRLSYFKKHLEDLLGRRKEHDELAEKYRKEIELLNTEEKNFTEATAKKKDAIDKLSQLKLDMESETVAKSEKLIELNSKWEETALQLDERRSELERQKSRRTSLEEIQKSYEGLAEGVKALMGDTGLSGNFELAANLFEVPAKYETAVGAVLGERLQYLVTDKIENSAVAVEFLDKNKSGRASIMLKEPRMDNSGKREPLSDPAILGTLSKFVRVKEGFERAAELLLSDIVVVKTTADAIRLYKENDNLDWTLSALDGGVVTPSGVLTGGPGNNAGTGVIQRNRQIKELNAAIKELEKEIESLTTKYDNEKQLVSDLKAGLDSLSKKAHQEEIKLVESKSELNRLVTEMGRLRERRETLKRELSRVQNVVKELGKEADEVSAQLGEIEKSEETRIIESESIKQKEAKLEQQLEEKRAKIVEIKNTISMLNERRENTKRQIKVYEEEKERLKKEKALNESRIVECNNIAETKSAEKEALESELKGKLEQFRSVKKDYEAGNTAYQSRSAMLSEKGSAIRKKEQELQERSRSVNDIELAKEKQVLAKNSLVAEFEEKYQINLTRLPVAEENFTEEMEARIPELREKIAELGQVNPNAVEEFDEMSKRYEFLTEQKSDLEGAVKKLERAISKINEVSKKRFEEAFAEINEKFSALFTRLFGGGNARLEIVHLKEGATDLLESGVEIIAQPPGEKVKHLELLSGGQKALTAVSFIFAMFLYRPSPFCLLDEIDAPLDDANIARVNDLIKELSAESQFIIITHNKATMELADTLYGVTNEEPGVSKVVGVKISSQSKAENSESSYVAVQTEMNSGSGFNNDFSAQ